MNHALSFWYEAAARLLLEDEAKAVDREIEADAKVPSPVTPPAPAPEAPR